MVARNGERVRQWIAALCGTTLRVVNFDAERRTTLRSGSAAVFDEAAMGCGLMHSSARFADGSGVRNPNLLGAIWNLEHPTLFAMVSPDAATDKGLSRESDGAADNLDPRNLRADGRVSPIRDLAQRSRIVGRRDALSAFRMRLAV